MLMFARGPSRKYIPAGYIADLGLPDAGELDIKLRLAVEIVRVIEARRLSQVAAAELLGINQPKVSALKNYKLDGFLVERLRLSVSGVGRGW